MYYCSFIHGQGKENGGFPFLVGGAEAVGNADAGFAPKHPICREGPWRGSLAGGTPGELCTHSTGALCFAQWVFPSNHTSRNPTLRRISYSWQAGSP